jgi:hypothetical protein
MLRRSNLILIVACVAFIAVMWIWASFGFVAVDQICAQTNNGAQPDCTPHYLPVVIGWKLLWWIGDNTNTLTVFGTFILAAVVLLQVIDARKSNERQLRAYLTTAVGQSFRQGASRKLKLEFRPIVLNTGQTPAYDVHVLNNMALLTPEQALIYDFRISEQARLGGVKTLMTLGPRQDRFTHVIAGRQLTRAEMRDWIGNKKLVYVYGTIYYRDAFKKPRFTNFCYSVVYWRKRGAALWHNINRHNESD